LVFKQLHLTSLTLLSDVHTVSLPYVTR